jgi:photosystem I P700 chlorophyll a apoprotein A2
LTQLAVLLGWLSVWLFHIAWLGNFHSFVQAASGLRPSSLSAHAIRDPHFGALSNASSLSVVSTSGLYQWYFTVGMTSESQLLHAAALLCATGTGLLVAAFFHSRAVF